jgi:hypothetical protein
MSCNCWIEKFFGTAISEYWDDVHTSNDALWIKKSKCIRAFILKEFEALEPLSTEPGGNIVTLEPLNRGNPYTLDGTILYPGFCSILHSCGIF